MNQFIVEIIANLQLVGVALLMIFISPEIIMPFVGYAAWSGAISFWGGMSAGIVGSTVGSLLLYGIAWHVHSRVELDKASRLACLTTIAPAKLERIFGRIDTHAKTTVFFYRFLPAFRSLTCVLAGLQNMPLTGFIGAVVAANTISIVLLTILGYLAQASYQAVSDTATIVVTYIAIGMTIMLVVKYGLRRKRTADS